MISETEYLREEAMRIIADLWHNTSIPAQETINHLKVLGAEINECIEDLIAEAE